MKQIDFYQENIPVLKINEQLIKESIFGLIEEESRQIGIISVIFCNDSYLLKINKEFLNHDYYTDIITFNYNEGEIISGDLFISIDRIKDNSVKYKNTFEEELLRVIFHGILHLIGYNDKTSLDKLKIREKEDYYIMKNELCWRNMML